MLALFVLSDLLGSYIDDNFFICSIPILLSVLLNSSNNCFKPFVVLLFVEFAPNVQLSPILLGKSESLSFCLS